MFVDRWWCDRRSVGWFCLACDDVACPRDMHLYLVFVLLSVKDKHRLYRTDVSSHFLLCEFLSFWWPRKHTVNIVTYLRPEQYEAQIGKKKHSSNYPIIITRHCTVASFQFSSLAFERRLNTQLKNCTSNWILDSSTPAVIVVKGHLLNVIAVLLSLSMQVLDVLIGLFRHA